MTWIWVAAAENRDFPDLAQVQSPYGNYVVQHCFEELGFDASASPEHLLFKCYFVLQIYVPDANC